MATEGHKRGRKMHGLRNFTHLTQEQLSNFTQLAQIEISDSGLKYIHEQAFGANRKLNEIILQRNPLQCNCSVAFLRQGADGLSSMLPWLAVTDGTVGDDELRCRKDGPSLQTGDEHTRLSDLDYDGENTCEAPNITYVSPAQTAEQENDTLHFECSAVGIPTPDLKWQWTDGFARPDYVLSASNECSNETNSSSEKVQCSRLTLRANVRMNQPLLCIAENVVYGSSKPVNVTVYAPPSVTIFRFDNRRPLTFHVLGYAWPPPYFVNFTVNGVPPNIPGRFLLRTSNDTGAMWKGNLTGTSE
ncbi:BDNF/NT-3 growth factors receptor-like [Tropilaelaps mercedesae]|uniref:BDNF/NT-3 growth factors receptor-like n=1 Tax=Tropilaelaps mercedesae TaxID=418985 RepID=A0A1V9XTG2_9ACAR|nr:BDNF/NT-3 growth factors receptor-like [Tropilaelaps mercedesae]